MTPSTIGLPAAIRAATLRRTSSLTGTESHPDSRNWPRVAGLPEWPNATEDIWPTVPLAQMQRVIAYFVALVVSVVALAFGIRLAADNSSAFDRFKDGTVATTTSTTLPGPRPAAGQAFVKGTITKLTAEGAQGAPLATPFTLAAVERGVGKATIENALVDGKRTSIAWGGGTPLPITGTDGSLDVS